MKKCPVCGSKKFYGSPPVGYHCLKCGYKNIPESIRKRLENDHKAGNDRVIIGHHSHQAIVINSPENKQLSTGRLSMNEPLFDAIHDLHNNAYKFRIVNDNKVDWPRQKGFKGNIRVTEFKGHKVKKTSKWLIVYRDGRNRVPLKKLQDENKRIYDEIKGIAIVLADKYGFTIDQEPLLFTSNRPEVKTPFLSSNNFDEPQAKAVYPLPSPIELKGVDAVKNAVNLTVLLSEFKVAMEREILNKRKHEDVLDTMKETLIEIKNNVSLPLGKTAKMNSHETPGCRLTVLDTIGEKTVTCLYLIDKINEELKIGGV